MESKLTKLIILFSIGILFVLGACQTSSDDHSTVLDIKNFKKVILNNDHVFSVSVLNVFPFTGNRPGKIKAANLYVCKFTNAKDTFLLFDVSKKKIPHYLKDKDIMNYLIFSNDIVQCPQKIKVSLPNNYSLPTRYQYLCASIKMLED